MQSFLILIAGLVLLTFAGDALVRGGVALARRLGVPELIVGLTIISMGTSAPELFVSLEAAIKGFSGLAIGNVVGSNIANVLAVLGLPALFAPVLMQEKGIRRSVTFMVAISLVLFVLMLDSGLGRFDGAVLLVLLAVYLGYSFHSARKDRAPSPEAGHEAEGTMPLPKALVFLAIGIAGLFFGGNLTVDGALGIAAIFGLADTAVGTTIVALGTTLPEIVATLAASIRKSSGVAIGNVIGSNVFNILGILGLTAIVTPMAVDPRLFQFDVWVMLAAAIGLMVLAFARTPIGRVPGLLLILVYCGYLFAALSGSVPG